MKTVLTKCATSTTLFAIFCLTALLCTTTLLADETTASKTLIGYTQFRTNLKTRYQNVTTMRAHVVHADGSETKPVARQLIEKPHQWTQFAAWSPDGTQAIIGCGWESPENATWEESHRTFRFNAEGWLYDTHLLDMATGQATNLTAVDRVSFYNTGIFFWPQNEKNRKGQLGFTALIDGISHPFRMDFDGKNKTDLSTTSKGFTYGFNASPDGKRIAYHKDYQIYVANADGSEATHVNTGNPFNFVPTWSPDGKHLLFVSGEHYNCHPHIVNRDGTGLKKIADRNGYRGVVTFLDVFDFHGGSSDVPVWAVDGQSFFYTAKTNGSIELFQASLDGSTKQLTNSPAGSHSYHPQPSPAGDLVLFGSNKTGTRQLYVMHLATGKTQAITDVPEGHGAMWAHWQPAAD